MNNVPPILSLPPELLIEIWRCLGPKDQGAFRKTCKKLDMVLFHSFGIKYFIQRQFMLTEDSLGALLAISKSRFSIFLKHVIISHERLVRYPNEEWGRDQALNSRKDNYCAQYADQMTFINIGRDIDMLTEAFRCLDLETVAVHNDRVFSQYGNYTPPYPESYGSRAIQEATGVSPSESSGGADYLELSGYTAAMVTKLLYALGMANATLKRLEFPVRLIPDIAFHVPYYLEASVGPMLSRVQNIRFGLNYPSPWPIDRRLVTSDANEAYEINTYHLRRLLGYCTQLRYIEIFGGATVQSHENSFLRWLAAEPVAKTQSSFSSALTLTRSPTPVAFPSLQNLVLRFIHIDVDNMLRLFDKVGPNIMSLWFIDITLIDSNVTDNSSPNHWSSCLLKLSTSAPQLRDIQIIRPRQSIGDGMSAYMYFQNGESKINHASHTGIDMQMYLEDLAPKVV